MVIKIIGAGITGITLAERLSDLPVEIEIYEKRNHIGGLCFDYKGESGILEQKYGPHIFHTNDKKVWKYLNSFEIFREFKHKVKSLLGKSYYSVPISLRTLKELKTVSFKRAEKLLYESYSRKMWGSYFDEIYPLVKQRVELRKTFNENYFLDRFQGLPSESFTSLFNKMLCKKNIKVHLKEFYKIKKDLENEEIFKIIYTGRVDQLFDYRFGVLDFLRTRFLFSVDFSKNSRLEYPVINYPEEDISYIRETEFNKLTTLNSPFSSVCTEEVKKANKNETPAYPVLTSRSKNLWYEYYRNKPEKIVFAGRFGLFAYFDMDDCVKNALVKAESIKKEWRQYERNKLGRV